MSFWDHVLAAFVGVCFGGIIAIAGWCLAVWML